MRIRLLFLALLGALLAPDVAQAQPSVYICVGPPAIGACKPVDATNPLPVNATTTISGFTALTTGTPISVTTGGVTGTLPAGTVVVATNVGATNGAYCALGASATTSSQYLSPGGGWFAFTVGASTQLTCITSTSTTTVNMTGGSGIPTGTGGGGGSSGGGAVTVANGADTAEGSIGDGAYAGSGNSTVIAALKGIYAGVIGPIPTQANTVSIGAVGQSGTWTNTVTQATAANLNATVVGTGTFAVQAAATLAAETTKVVGTVRNADGNGVLYVSDPCSTAAKTTLPITLATAAVKVIAVGVSAKKIYVCHLQLTNNAADSIALFEATTGTTCVTSPVAVVGGGTSVATAATGYNFSANGGINTGVGSNQIHVTTVNNNDLCIAQSAITQLTGTITYVTQ